VPLIRSLKLSTDYIDNPSTQNRFAFPRLPLHTGNFESPVLIPDFPSPANTYSQPGTAVTSHYSSSSSSNDSMSSPEFTQYMHGFQQNPEQSMPAASQASIEPNSLFVSDRSVGNMVGICRDEGQNAGLTTDDEGKMSK
jgi:hypothetical protein